jgi:glycosyltransferase involved in cell wall biosynthesis
LRGGQSLIKILNIISDKNIGGAGRCVLNFLKYYDRKNFAVKVVVPRGSLLKPEIEKLHTKVIEVDGIADKSLDWKAITKLNKIIKKEKPDVVHTHGTVTGRICARMCHTKVVYTRHSVFPVSPRVKHGLGRLANKYINEFLADDIIAVAEAAKENLTDGGIAPEKIKVILNGVEQVQRCSEEVCSKLRQQYGITEDDFVIGILARIDAVKGHEFLIEAAEQLKKEGKSIKVLIAGTGDREEALKKMVKEKGLTEEIRFTGFISNIPEFLSILDVQANSSYGTEATSLALLEGMSMGIPAVVSNYGGNPGVITHGENGYLFESKNSRDMAKYLRKMMEEKDKYDIMSQRAKEIFQEKFTAELYARNIEAVYAGLF